jgi:guanylate kinase/adenylate cyclase class IV
MARNQEIKFLSDMLQVPDEIFRLAGFVDEKRYFQEDIYAVSETHFFKLRINDRVPAKLLKYRRLTSPVLRESSFEAYELQDESSRKAANFIFQNIAIAGVVRKERQQFVAENMLLNVDSVYRDDEQRVLYRVIEIECLLDDPSVATQDEMVQEILNAFHVKPYELLPYSNIHMVNMIRWSEYFRNELAKESHTGRLILIDGGSATGKSTIKNLLTERYKLGYARRDTTRSSRPDDSITHDYNFVSRTDFDLRALMGKYVEFRDFLFGMSYGLLWSEFVGALSRGENMMALINLGNGYFTKRLFPEATLVLLYADLKTIRARLESRGTMTREQIEERLENNRLARTYLDAYDLAINTSEVGPEEVAERIFRR